MIAPLLDGEPLGARIYAAKIDTEQDLGSEWMMVARPDLQYATFYSLEAERYPGLGKGCPKPIGYSVSRFLVSFADLKDDQDDEDPCSKFIRYREDLEGRWCKVGEIKVERQRLLSLIKTVGKFAPREDDDWTERVILSTTY